MPIPLVFDAEDEFFTLDHPADPNSQFKKICPEIFKGWRPDDSMKMYRKLFSNKNEFHYSDFPMKLPQDLPPAVQKLLDFQMQERILGSAKIAKCSTNKLNVEYEGMNPEFQEMYDNGESL